MAYREELPDEENEDGFFSRVRKAWERIERCRWRPSNSTTEPGRGSGDGLPRDDANGVVPFVSVFKEQSISHWHIRLSSLVDLHWKEQNICILYDIYHMQIMEGDIIRTIQQYHEYFAHYHTAGTPVAMSLTRTRNSFILPLCVRFSRQATRAISVTSLARWATRYAPFNRRLISVDFERVYKREDEYIALSQMELFVPLRAGVRLG